MGTDLATSIYGSLSADTIPESDPASSKPTEESEPTPNKTKNKGKAGEDIHSDVH